MFSLLKRFRDVALIAALLLVPLGVYFAHARRPSERSRLDRFFIVMTAPIERGVAWAVGGALEGWRGYVALRGVRERAQELSRQVNALELERLDKVRVEAENERLRKLLAFAESEPGFRLVGARVIGVRLDPKGLQLIRIDRGADHGVEKLMPVVVAQGVVGRVHAVTGTTADVLLVSDLNSSVAVRVARSRARANVRGTGDPAVCRLDYALRSDDLQEGDELVTSGTDAIFPRGLPVGRIANLKKTGQGLYQKADVVPAVDVTRIEEVLVLRSRAEGGRDEPVATPGGAATKAAAPGAQATRQAQPPAAKPSPAAVKPPPPAAKGPPAAAHATPPPTGGHAGVASRAPAASAPLATTPAAATTASSAAPAGTKPNAAPASSSAASTAASADAPAQKPKAVLPRPAIPKPASFDASPTAASGTAGAFTQPHSAPAVKAAANGTRKTAAKNGAPARPKPAPAATATPRAQRAEARAP